MLKSLLIILNQISQGFLYIINFYSYNFYCANDNDIHNAYGNYVSLSTVVLNSRDR